MSSAEEPPQAPAGSPASDRGSTHDPEGGIIGGEPPPAHEPKESAYQPDQTNNATGPNQHPSQPNMKQLLETVHTGDLPSYEDVTGGHVNEETLRLSPMLTGPGNPC